MSKSSLHCCYERCTEQDVLDARIEVKTVLPQKKISKAARSKMLVKWKPSGEAEFHIKCWEEVLAKSATGARKTTVYSRPVMFAEEKALVKAAAEAPEQFDSHETVLEEARRAAEWIRTAKQCVTFTGAGISTSAGIGDYRGKSGKWTEEDQSHSHNMDSVFAASSSTDTDEPAAKKRKVKKDLIQEEEPEAKVDEDGVPYEKLRPTYTHEALKKLMDLGYLKYVLSQNGDGLHGLSGIPEKKMSELHGNVFVEVCEKCEKRYARSFYVLDDVGSQYYEEMEDYGKSSVKKPKFAKECDRCGLSHRTGRKCEKKGCSGHLKDSIINFCDLLEDDVLDRAWDQTHKCDVMLCLGTTLQVTPASDLVKNIKHKSHLIICNRQETPLDDLFKKKGPDGKPVKGCRVFGDCDVFMKEVMKSLLSETDIKEWETGRGERMKQYNKLRD